MRVYEPTGDPSDVRAERCATAAGGPLRWNGRGLTPTSEPYATDAVAMTRGGRIPTCVKWELVSPALEWTRRRTPVRYTRPLARSMLRRRSSEPGRHRHRRADEEADSGSNGDAPRTAASLNGAVQDEARPPDVIRREPRERGNRVRWESLGPQPRRNARLDLVFHFVWQLMQEVEPDFPFDRVDAR